MSSEVYFTPAKLNEGEKNVSQKALKLFRAGGFKNCFVENDFTAVKVHIGEGGNTTYIKAPYFKGLVDELLRLKTKPFVTDTSTLYTGRRHNAIDHSILAEEHGFNAKELGAPFIPPDGLFGNSEIGIRIDGELNKQVFVASDISRCQSMLALAHFTGHPATCAAASLKTIGMGCTSRKGKMRQHSALNPSIKDNCRLCGECYENCPADAITLGDVKAHIDRDKCIGCAECLAVCRFNAVKFDWAEENEALQKNIAEHALGVLKDKSDRVVFYNFVMSVAKDCDCMKTPDIDLIIDDIGILASTDPVALDQAALDMVEQKGGKQLEGLIGNKKLRPEPLLEHAEKIGLGSREYKIVQID